MGEQIGGPGVDRDAARVPQVLLREAAREEPHRADAGAPRGERVPRRVAHRHRALGGRVHAREGGLEDVRVRLRALRVVGGRGAVEHVVDGTTGL